MFSPFAIVASDCRALPLYPFRIGENNRSFMVFAAASVVAWALVRGMQPNDLEEMVQAIDGEEGGGNAAQQSGVQGQGNGNQHQQSWGPVAVGRPVVSLEWWMVAVATQDLE